MKETAREFKRKKTSKEPEHLFRMAIISSRGQVTIPQDVREIMHLKRGSVIGFEPTKRGVLMVAMKVEPQYGYSQAELGKIEKLTKGKGKVYHSPEDAKKHIANL